MEGKSNISLDARKASVLYSDKNIKNIMVKQDSFTSLTGIVVGLPPNMLDIPSISVLLPKTVLFSTLFIPVKSEYQKRGKNKKLQNS